MVEVAEERRDHAPGCLTYLVEELQ
ncbi:MAG: hypothetical protein JWR55_1971, partial [Aeromicrobium sp.]|nr:hypothetical protein [Aeromicrobium sp.]